MNCLKLNFEKKIRSEKGTRRFLNEKKKKKEEVDVQN